MSLFMPATVFAAQDDCILQTLSIKHEVKLLSGTTHILISMKRKPLNNFWNWPPQGEEAFVVWFICLRYFVWSHASD